jgi:uncharacterized protein (DUF1684 family)
VQYLSLLLSFISILPLPRGVRPYQAEIAQWRHAREERLRADDGWLTVAGLFWLKEGHNSIGAGPGNSLVLPKGSAPDVVGDIVFHAGTRPFFAAVGTEVTVNGKPIKTAYLKSDTPGPPDVVRVRDLTMFVIQRGSRVGIRLKDKNSATRRNFKGLRFFPVRDEYRVKAKFVPYNLPRKVAVPNILGDVEEDSCPGYVVFKLRGRELRLDPLEEGDMLFFIFKDQTAGKETYPSGRFLFTDLPQNGEVVLDFNKAVNPPCAFTPYATCPLPPKQNHLPLRIEAGELRYGH